MYRANLSHEVLSEYLALLLRTGLISEERSPKRSSKLYRTTEKGTHYLEIYGSLMKMIGEKVSRKELTPESDVNEGKALAT
jgi:predicted transcriptional regulator